METQHDLFASKDSFMSHERFSGPHDEGTVVRRKTDRRKKEGEKDGQTEIQTKRERAKDRKIDRMKKNTSK